MNDLILLVTIVEVTIVIFLDNTEESDTLTHHDNDPEDDTSNNTDHGLDNIKSLISFLSTYSNNGAPT